jgi:F-type H+-transporting ATPase subunit gamma
MELIAASRIVRAQNRIAGNRPYREGMERVLRLTAAADSQAAAKLLGTPESPRHIGILAVVGDRGLAGSYNSGVLRATERRVAELRANGAEVTVWSVGKKAPSYFRYRGIEMAQSFVGFADRPEFSDARQIASVVAAPFIAGEIDLVEMVSTRFISAGTQRVERLQMLPLPLPEADQILEVDLDHLEGYTEFEPEPEKLLIELAPRALESEIFAALLEGTASFFTAQQRAMAAATENADELVRTLTRVMNRARQDAITTEIMEIVGGAEALRQAKGA